MTYQFFHPHRDTQYFYLKRLLKENGLIVIQEKLLLDDEEEYERREQIKDTLFKPLYFTKEEIQRKRATALVSPVGFLAGQVNFDTCVNTLKGYFNNVVWPVCDEKIPLILYATYAVSVSMRSTLASPLVCTSFLLAPSISIYLRVISN